MVGLADKGHAASPTSATCTAWERTPWRATQRAAWEALKAATSYSRASSSLR
jgi:hypothetical protein